MDQHNLVVAVKDLAIELGRTPTRTEFCRQVRGGDYKIRAFGGFVALLYAAGLETYDPRRSGKKINNSIFERDIEEHLEKFESRAVPVKKPYPNMAVISDIHWPFVNDRVIQAFYKYVEQHKPEWVIINGDAWDMYSHSKYPRSHNVFTPRDEQALARKQNEEFWREIKKRAPGAQCVQMLGNHDIRPMKRILESYPEAEDWIEEKLKSLFSFDGVKTIHDPREELLIDDILVFHGYRSQLGAHRDYTLYSCVNGHTHVGGVVFRQIRGAVLFEANSGVAGDPESKGLSYTPQKITKWTPGFFACDSHGPRFIPA